MKKLYIYISLLILPAVVSIFYLDILKRVPKTIKFAYKNGEMINSAPFPPSIRSLFGVDRNGNQMLFVVLEGYKTTLLIISLMVIIIFIIALIIATYVALINKNIQIIKAFTNPFIFIPQSILAYILLYPIIYEPIEHFKTTMMIRILYYLMILMLLSIPTMITLLIDLTKLEMQHEYILSAKTMHHSKQYIYFKHLLPNLWPQYLIVICRMLLQLIVVITHLSFFKLYFGGTDVCYGPACLYIEKPMINELSSLVGYHFSNINNAWWTFYAPLLSLLYMLVMIRLIQHQLEHKFNKERV